MTPTAVAIEPDRFPWYDPRGFTFSLGLCLDRDVWCSGHSGSAHDPRKGRPDVPDTMTAQARIAYAKQAAVLTAAGTDLTRVTRVLENVTAAGLEHYAEAERVRREVFGTHRPVVVTTVVDRLVRRKALIEIEVHANTREPAPNPDDDAPGPDGIRTAHDGSVLLPTLLPLDDHGEVVAPGDPAGQYAHCLGQAARLLRPLGLGLADLTCTVDFAAPGVAEDWAHIDRVRARLLGPIHPAGTRVRAQTLHRPGVLVCVTATASRHPRSAVGRLGLRAALPTYSPGVRSGNLLHISGFGRLAAGLPDLAAQARSVYGAILHTMRAAHAGPAYLVSTVEYVAADALAQYRDVATVRRAMLKQPYPVSTGIVCTRMPHPGSLIDVSAIAYLPEAV
jgi:enamine deaminase RidA (YjgF/YER057c/UK114 family)